jgi:hypothetical protein
MNPEENLQAAPGFWGGPAGWEVPQGRVLEGRLEV